LLTVEDSATKTGQTYTITQTLVERADGPRKVNYTTVEHLVLNAATVGGNQINVWAVPAGTDLSVNGGAANDRFDVGNAGNLLDDIRGPVTAAGMDGTDRIELHDSAHADGEVYTI